MQDIDLTRLSKRMSFALRHHPERLGLEPDARGYVGLDGLVAALNSQYTDWPRPVTGDDVAEVVAHGSKQRFELDGRRVRARYGHSFGRRVEHEAAEPPAVLFHGTSHRSWGRIREEGLRPMGRQTVHCSADEETAISVGARHERGGEPVLLRVDAAAAFAAGVTFYRGNDSTWLSDAIPPEFLSLISE